MAAQHEQRAAKIWSVHTGRIPSGAPASSSLVFTDLYALSLNGDTKVADWVGYRVTASSQSGRNSLSRNWVHREKDLTLESSDYLHSGYAIGHLCPLASVRSDADAWEVNWTGAVAPQRQSLNAGPWLRFEEFTRQLGRLHGLAMVMCGPLYELEMPPLAKSDEPHVVPSHFWARVFVPRTGKLQAWIMPQDALRKDSEAQYRVEPSEVSQRSGLTFWDSP